MYQVFWGIAGVLAVLDNDSIAPMAVLQTSDHPVSYSLSPATPIPADNKTTIALPQSLCSSEGAGVLPWQTGLVQDLSYDNLYSWVTEEDLAIHQEITGIAQTRNLLLQDVKTKIPELKQLMDWVEVTSGDDINTTKQKVFLNRFIIKLFELQFSTNFLRKYQKGVCDIHRENVLKRLLMHLNKQPWDIQKQVGIYAVDMHSTHPNSVSNHVYLMLIPSNISVPADFNTYQEFLNWQKQTLKTNIIYQGGNINILVCDTWLDTFDDSLTQAFHSTDVHTRLLNKLYAKGDHRVSISPLHVSYFTESILKDTGFASFLIELQRYLVEETLSAKSLENWSRKYHQYEQLWQKQYTDEDDFITSE